MMKFLIFMGLGLLSFGGVAATLSEQVNAAKKIASTDPSCVAIRPFYWEIGDNLSALVSGSNGIAAPTAKSVLDIASATKWIFSAYAAEKKSGVLSISEKAHLRMLSGYDQFVGCLSFSTVEGCLSSGSNDDFTPESVGKFAYGGGHMQKLAVNMALGRLGNPGLTIEINKLVGTSGSFKAPQVAGGYSMSSQDYGFFLRRLLNNKLKLAPLLGTHAVCTTPSECPAQVVSSPAPAGWKYSLGHWVEADGTFSSPGKFGFYPWMDTAKSLYGVIGRKSSNPNAYLESVECGQKIKTAFITGK